MLRRLSLLLISFALVTAAQAARAASPLDAAIFELEGGPFYVLRNDGHYGKGGTEIDAGDLAQDHNLHSTFRLSLELRPHRRHGVTLLWAPLTVDSSAELRRDVQFRGTSFTAGSAVFSTYRFEGYRGTWLYRLFDRDGLVWDVGVAAQIRNALVAIQTTDGSRRGRRSDIGLVPALATRLTYWPAPACYLQLDAVGLSTFGVGDTSGALYDVALAFGLPLDEEADTSAFLRLRVYGGGVEFDDGSLENWATFLFLTAGIRLNLAALFAGP